MRYNAPYGQQNFIQGNDQFHRMAAGFEDYATSSEAFSISADLEIGFEQYSVSNEENIFTRIWRRIFDFISGLLRRVKELFTKRKTKEKLAEAKKEVAELGKDNDDIGIVVTVKSTDLSTKDKSAKFVKIGASDALVPVPLNQAWLFGSVELSNVSDMFDRADKAMSIAIAHEEYIGSYLTEIADLIKILLSSDKDYSELQIDHLQVLRNNHDKNVSSILNELRIPSNLVVNEKSNIATIGDLKLNLAVTSVRPTGFTPKVAPSVLMDVVPPESNFENLIKQTTKLTSLVENSTDLLNSLNENKRLFENNADRVGKTKPDNLKLAVSLLDTGSRIGTIIPESTIIADAVSAITIGVCGKVTKKD